MIVGIFIKLFHLMADSLITLLQKPVLSLLRLLTHHMFGAYVNISFMLSSEQETSIVCQVGYSLVFYRTVYGCSCMCYFHADLRTGNLCCLAYLSGHLGNIIRNIVFGCSCMCYFHADHRTGNQLY